MIFSRSLYVFNRQYVFWPLLLLVVLVIAGFVNNEISRYRAMNESTAIRDAQERMRFLAELVYATAEAESSQRGYLLLHEERYLEPFDAAVTKANQSLDQLRVMYRANDEQGDFSQLETMVQKKLLEMQTILEFDSQSQDEGTAAMELVKTDIGLHWMTQIRHLTEKIRNAERAHIYRRIEHWQALHKSGRLIAAASAGLNVLLMLIAGLVVSRSIERRTSAAVELDQLVAQRTRELSELSSHLTQVSEREKTLLSRELHDELGSLLVAIKMDLAQIGKSLDLTVPETAARWQRIQQALVSGVELKRRIIEDLRPTLLDNLGLMAALRWYAERMALQSGLQLQLSLPEHSPTLHGDAAIAIFRVLQEALTNVAKHAHAKHLDIRAQLDGTMLIVTIADDGVGLRATDHNKTGSHGFSSMRHRIQSVGGQFTVRDYVPTGTEIEVKVPVEDQAAAQSHAAAGG